MKTVLTTLLLLLNYSLYASEGSLSVTYDYSDGLGQDRAVIENILNPELENEANQHLPTTTGNQYADGLYHSQMATISTTDTSAQYQDANYRLQLNTGFGWRGGSLSDVMNDPAAITGIGLSNALALSIRAGAFSKTLEHLTIHLGLIKMDLPGIVSELSGELKLYKLLASYTFAGNKFWQGVTLTTGIIKNQLDLTIHVDVDETASSGGISGALTGSFNMSTHSEVTSIPLFISSGINIFNFVNLFAMAGGHLAKGNSSVSALFQAVVTFNGTETSYSNAHYSLNGSFEEGFSFNPLLLVGANLRLLPFFNLGLEYAKMSDDSSLGLNISIPF